MDKKKDISMDTSMDTSMDEKKDTSMDEKKDISMDTSMDEKKDTGMDDKKDISMDTSMDEKKDTSMDTVSCLTRINIIPLAFLTRDETMQHRVRECIDAEAWFPTRLLSHIPATATPMAMSPPYHTLHDVLRPALQMMAAQSNTAFPASTWTSAIDTNRWHRLCARVWRTCDIVIVSDHGLDHVESKIMPRLCIGSHHIILVKFASLYFLVIGPGLIRPGKYESNTGHDSLVPAPIISMSTGAASSYPFMTKTV